MDGSSVSLQLLSLSVFMLTCKCDVCLMHYLRVNGQRQHRLMYQLLDQYGFAFMSMHYIGSCDFHKEYVNSYTERLLPTIISVL